MLCTSAAPERCFNACAATALALLSFNTAQVLTTSLLQRAIVYPKAYRGVDLKQVITACGQLCGQLWSGTAFAKTHRAIVLLSCDPCFTCVLWLHLVADSKLGAFRLRLQSIILAIHPHSACSWWRTTSWSGSSRGWRRRWHGPAVRRLAWCAEMAQPVPIGSRSRGTPAC